MIDLRPQRGAQMRRQLRQQQRQQQQQEQATRHRPPTGQDLPAKQNQTSHNVVSEAQPDGSFTSDQ